MAYQPGGRGVVDKAWDKQSRIEARLKHLGKGRYGRVLRMARKPDNEEFMQNSKVTAVGILVIGGLGFVIFLFMDKIPGLLGF